MRCRAYDERDPASLVSSRPRLLATATEDWPLAPLFVFVKTHAWKDADAATHEAFGELAEHLGGQIDGDLPRPDHRARHRRRHGRCSASSSPSTSARCSTARPT